MKKLVGLLFLLSFISSCRFDNNRCEEGLDAESKEINFSEQHDVVILGSGPAGLTAGIYAARAGLNPIIVEGNRPGGLLPLASCVENWPGEKTISGIDLIGKIVEHAKKLGCRFLSDTVVKVDFSKGVKSIFTEGREELKTRSVIITTGASHKKLSVPREEEYIGSGVSYCATCDAPFFKDKNVVVIGGGNSALVEAEHLAQVAKKVTIIHTSPKFSVEEQLKQRVLSNPVVHAIHSSIIKEIQGDGIKVTHVVIEDKDSHTISNVATDGVFIAIGFDPNTDIFNNQIDLDSNGYIILKKGMQSSREGVFAAGDVTNGLYKQAIIAAGDGAKAALDCQRYLAGRKE
jgi:thioredoxin reductase (NADPH)